MNAHAKTQRRHKDGKFARQGKPAVSATTADGHALAPVDKLISDPSDDVRWYAATNPNLTDDQYAQLASDKVVVVRRSLAENTHCSAESLSMLARDSNSSVRASVGGNVSCPPDTLAVLAADDNGTVRRAVVCNPSSTPETFRLRDSTPGFGPVFERFGRSHPDEQPTDGQIARNPDTPAEKLAELAQSSVPVVRGRVAANPSCPPETFKQLLDDESPQVVMHAISGPNCDTKRLTQLADDPDFAKRQSVALNQNCPSDVLDKLSLENNDSLRSYVAVNRNTTDRTLTALANSDDFRVRRAVAGRPTSLPEPIIRELAKDKWEVVVEEVVERADCPSDVLETIARSGKKDLSSRAIMHPAVPKALLWEMSSGTESQRCFVAANPAAGSVQPPSAG